MQKVKEKPNQTNKALFKSHFFCDKEILFFSIKLFEGL